MQCLPKFRVLFLCTGNSARSIFAEYLLRHLGGHLFEVSSAGSKPSGHIHPLVLHILQENFHIDASDARSKSWHELENIHFDFIITLCDDARERCPIMPGEPITAHWSFPDPASFQGSQEEIHAEFVRLAFAIRRRVELFSSLPFEKLDRLQRQIHIREIHRDADLSHLA